MHVRSSPARRCLQAVYWRSSMTTAWHAMLRFSPRLSTFSWVLAFMLTTLRGQVERVERVGQVRRSARGRWRASLSTAKLPASPKSSGGRQAGAVRTWGARPASGTGCLGSPPCAATSWAAAVRRRGARQAQGWLIGLAAPARRPRLGLRVAWGEAPRGRRHLRPQPTAPRPQPAAHTPFLRTHLRNDGAVDVANRVAALPHQPHRLLEEDVAGVGRRGEEGGRQSTQGAW